MPNSGHERPKSGPGWPKSGQERPKIGQERPKSAQELPKSGQEPPKSAQDRPTSGQKCPKRSPTGTKKPKSDREATDFRNHLLATHLPTTTPLQLHLRLLLSGDEGDEARVKQI